MSSCLRIRRAGISDCLWSHGLTVAADVWSIQRDKTIDFIQVRHEEMGAFIASAYAKFSGQISAHFASCR